MTPEMIAQSPDGKIKMYATLKIDIGGNTIYWGYVESDGEKSKKVNLSTILSTNDRWKLVDGIEI